MARPIEEKKREYAARLRVARAYRKAGNEEEQRAARAEHARIMADRLIRRAHEILASVDQAPK